MKLLLLNYEFPPLGGGAGNATYFLLQELSKNTKLKIDLVTSSPNRYLKKKFSSNITIHFLNVFKQNKNLHHQSLHNLLIYSIKSLAYSKRLLKKNNYDLVHAFFSLPSGFVACLLKKPFIISLRGSDVPFYNQRFYWLDKLIFRYLHRFILKKAKHVVANSGHLKKLALKSFPNQEIKVIPNGVDNSLFKPTKSLKKPVILFVGRLIKRKGIHLLLKAFSNLDQDYQDKYQIWLVGDGPLYNDLKNLALKLKIKKSVKFLGLKTRAQLKSIYNQTQIFVLPSQNEGMSNAVLEAMACGLPIITTNTGGSKELIKENGFILKNSSASELSKLLLTYIKNPALIKKHSQTSIKQAKLFSWEKVSNQYLDLYQL